MNKINYQKILDRTIEEIVKDEKVPKLLLHSCCAPCSSYCLEYLSNYFEITVYYYNPNITMADEYEKRAEELKRLVEQMPFKNPVHYCVGPYEPEKFFQIAKGYEHVKEGGERCFRCYEQRLEETARVAKEKGFDYFTTTLSISPLKNAQKLNEIGKAMSDAYGVSYLFSDFKKKNGYKRSVELSEVYHLYRQNYCGCIYSKVESEQRDSGI